MKTKNTNTQVLAQVRMANGSVVDIYDIELARQMGLIPTPTSAPTGKGKAQPKVEGKAKDTAFTKHDGTVVMTTKAQAAAWEKHRQGYKSLDEVKKTWEADRKAYKPSKAFVDAIKADRASITHKVAKEKFGFVGTKNDLKALKDELCK